MNAAVALAAGRVPGVSVALEGLVPGSADPDSLIDAVDSRLLGGGLLTAHTREVLRDQLADIRNPAAARTLVVGLALGGPEFQRQ
jgi:hypothetical protein